MLDAVGGHVAKRIRARHVSAMTRPSDIAALLQVCACMRACVQAEGKASMKGNVMAVCGVC